MNEIMSEVMNEQLNLTVKIKKDQLLCKEGEPSCDLYKIISGKLMVCTRKNRMVTPLAFLEANEYFGELSFFDRMERSADVIAVEDTVLIKIPMEQLEQQFPRWLHLTAQSMTKKLRLLDDIIKKRGIKKQNVEHIKPLSIEEQRYFYEIIENSEVT